jgi:uncharacterized protein (TIGR03435 family)
MPFKFCIHRKRIMTKHLSKDNLPPEVRDRLSIFDALKQQLGLKLVAQKGPVDYYVIDHIDRPTDN